MLTTSGAIRVTCIPPPAHAGLVTRLLVAAMNAATEELQQLMEEQQAGDELLQLAAGALVGHSAFWSLGFPLLQSSVHGVVCPNGVLTSMHKS